MRSTHTNGRRERAARLAELDALPAATKNAAGLAFERAQLLDRLGRTEAARAAYLALLECDSTHAGALNELGRLLERTGYVSAARTAFLRAVEANPADPTGHGNLATSFLDAGDVAAARQHYETAIALDPDHIVAHQCLAIVLLRLGDEAGAARHGRIGFRAGATAWPYRGSGDPVDVLVIHSALGGNVPIDRFIDDRIFAKATIVAEFFDPATPLPPHALVVNAIGDASRCRIALQAAERIVRATPAPVLNAPARVARTTREANARAFAGRPHAIAPRTAAYTRAQLSAECAASDLAAAGFGWPLIVRAAGFQTGLHCALVAAPAELGATLETLPAGELLAIEFIDVRASDGQVRKYRVMIVDGVLFPLHLAVSRHWMVHYFRADHEAAHDAEEAAFLNDMEGVLGAVAIAELHAVAAQLGLDYGGIDFALDGQGRVVVFEANATMIVPPADAETTPARRDAVGRVEAAVRALLLERARAGVTVQ